MIFIAASGLSACAVPPSGGPQSTAAAPELVRALAFNANGNASVFNDTETLEAIRSKEASGSYDRISGFAKFGPPKPISQMTIGEVLHYQQRLINAGAEATAVGAYQIKRSTLELTARQLGVGHDELFSAEMQDRMARFKLAKCGFYDSSKDVSLVGNCIAKVWAAFPMHTGSKKGKSRYKGNLNNKALVSVGEVRDLLAKRMVAQNVKLKLKSDEQPAPGAVQFYIDDGRFADRIPLSR